MSKVFKVAWANFREHPAHHPHIARGVGVPGDLDCRRVRGAAQDVRRVRGRGVRPILVGGRADHHGGAGRDAPGRGGRRPDGDRAASRDQGAQPGRTRRGGGSRGISRREPSLGRGPEFPQPGVRRPVHGLARGPLRHGPRPMARRPRCRGGRGGAVRGCGKAPGGRCRPEGPGRLGGAEAGTPRRGDRRRAVADLDGGVRPHGPDPEQRRTLREIRARRTAGRAPRRSASWASRSGPMPTSPSSASAGRRAWPSTRTPSSSRNRSTSKRHSTRVRHKIIHQCIHARRRGCPAGRSARHLLHTELGRERAGAAVRGPAGGDVHPRAGPLAGHPRSPVPGGVGLVGGVCASAGLLAAVGATSSKTLYRGIGIGPVGLALALGGSLLASIIPAVSATRVRAPA